MHRLLPRSLRIEVVILAVLGPAWHATPAAAHKLVVFATPAGRTLEGEVYFYGGAAARNVKVTVFGPNDQLLGETTTDEEGKFAFPIRFRCDYKLVADAGEGHAAKYTVAAAELPDDLPLPGGLEDPSGKQPGSAEPKPPVEADHEASLAASGEEPAATPHEGNLEARIGALSRQVAGLRTDLNKYKSKLRLQDVLGGLGYIFGIMGVVFYFLGVRREQERGEG